MRLSFPFLNFLVCISFLLSGTAAQAGDPVSKLSAGAPQAIGVQLPESSYVAFETKRLTHSKVVWLNFPLLKEMGIEVPAEGLTAQFESELLDALAYMVPQAKDPVEYYSSMSKVLYADRYGGTGLGRNWGSARAGVAGQIQIKGCGQTPLLGEGQGFDHAHGGASFEESIREALWGEVAHAQLPYGANRVIAIIDTGTYTHWRDGGKEPRALIIRQDAIRPAHFLKTHGTGKKMELTDGARVKAAVKFLDRALPMPESLRQDLSTGERIKAGLMEYSRRLAVQYAAAYVMSFFHGATSQSNVEISGRFIDYGTMTAQPQHGPIQILRSVDPFGMNDETKDLLLSAVLTEIKKTAPASIRDFLPTNEELNRSFDENYQRTLQIKFLELAGTPPELTEELLKDAAVLRFSERLIALSRARLDQGVINVDRGMPERTAKYDLRKILLALSQDPLGQRKNPLRELIDEMPVARTRNAFLVHYEQFYKVLMDRGKRDGVTSEALQTYVHENVKYRAREIPEMYRSRMKDENILLIQDYQRNGNRGTVWSSIDERIESGMRTPMTEPGYRLMIPIKTDRLEDLAAYRVFDARSDRHEVRLEVLDRGEKYYRILGNILHANEVSDASARFSVDGWNRFSEARFRKVGNFYRLHMPVSAVSRLEFVLRSGDHERWFKQNDRNVVIDSRLTLKSDCTDLLH